jgi:hypothetical protein
MSFAGSWLAQMANLALDILSGLSGNLARLTLAGSGGQTRDIPRQQRGRPVSDAVSCWSVFASSPRSSRATPSAISQTSQLMLNLPTLANDRRLPPDRRNLVKATIPSLPGQRSTTIKLAGTLHYPALQICSRPPHIRLCFPTLAHGLTSSSYLPQSLVC